MKNHILFIHLFFVSLNISSAQYIHPEPSKTLYDLCINTHKELIKEEIALYDHFYGQSIITRLCTCKMPFIISFLNERSSLLYSCLKQRSFLQYKLTLDKEYMEACSNNSEKQLKSQLIDMWNQCALLQNDFDQLVDENKLCTGEYCNFIKNTNPHRVSEAHRSVPGEMRQNLW